jgi:hypothetical protein
MLKKVLLGAGIAAFSLTSFTSMAGASTKSLVTGWFHKHGSVVRAIVGDVNTFNKENNHNKIEELTPTCSLLSTDVIAGKHTPPIPVAAFENVWKVVLKDYGRAADDCIAFTTSQRIAELNKGVAQMNAGTAALKKLGNLT